MKVGHGYVDMIHKIFNLFDTDKDGVITKSEAEGISEKIWQHCEDFMNDLDLLIEAIEKSTKFREEL